MSSIRMFFVTVFFAVWTALMATLAFFSHLLTLGVGDVSMWIARRLWVPPVLWFAGIDLDTRGSERLSPDQAYVAVANHQSVIDIMAMFIALPNVPIRFIAKQVLFYIPVFGWYLWLTGYISVNRSNRRKAFKSLDRAAKRINKRRSTVVVFAEGTRTPDGEIKRFKKGAFVLALRARAPVVPIAIAGAYAVMNRHRWRVAPGTIHVRVLEPIETKDTEYEERNELIRQTHTAIANRVDELRQEFGIQDDADTAPTSTGAAPVVT